MALKGAIELEVFSRIAAGAITSEAIAPLCKGTEKGVRVLCDYLTVHGFLTKAKGAYGLAPDTATLLDKKSPSYMGSAEFFTQPVMVNKYRDGAALVRNGGATDHTLSPNDNVWVEFARYMAPMFALPARIAATYVTTPGEPAKVLDIAAGTACSVSMLPSTTMLLKSPFRIGKMFLKSPEKMPQKCELPGVSTPSLAAHSKWPSVPATT